MVQKLKSGMFCDVITVTANKPTYEELMRKGSTGIVIEQHSSGAVTACIGLTDKIYNIGTKTVPKSEFKVVGRLRVNKVKKI